MSEHELGIFFFAVSMILLILFATIVLFIVRYRRRKIEHDAEKEKLEEQFSAELGKAKTELQVGIMKQIGAELHDTINQRLTLAYLHTGNMQKMQDVAELKKHTTEIGSIIMMTLNEIRGLSKILSAEGFSEFGLCGFLENELQRVQAAGFCNAGFSQLGPVPVFANEKAELMLARICQEFIQNSLKHASATRLNITVDTTGPRLKIICNDNGTGFDLKKAQQNGGQGIGNISRRAEMINAVVSWQTGSGMGTQLVIETREA